VSDSQSPQVFHDIMVREGRRRQRRPVIYTLGTAGRQSCRRHPNSKPLTRSNSVRHGIHHMHLLQAPYATPRSVSATALALTAIEVRAGRAKVNHICVRVPHR
jgi:hypothetical protein